MELRAIDNTDNRQAAEPAPDPPPRYLRWRPARFVAELRRRRVSQTMVTYAVLVWVAIQTGDVLFPMLGLPDWSLHLVVLIALLGLPIVIYLAWTFQITPRGVMIDSGPVADAPGVSEDPATTRACELVLNLILLVVGLALTSMLATDQAFAIRESEHALHASALPADDITRNWTLALALRCGSDRVGGDRIARGVQEELRHLLIQMPGITVVDLDEGSPAPGRAETPLLLSGSVVAAEAKLHALVHLSNVGTGAYIWSATLDMPSTDLLAAEQAAAKQIADRLQRELRDLRTPG